MERTKNSNSGGAAAHSGIGYQDRVAAWLCAQILADQEATPPWEWPASSTLESISCETEQAVDDILVIASHQGRAFINVKRSLIASQSEDSDFASALSQFVRQFITAQNHTRKDRLEERPIDLKLDRFVLATSSESSVPVKSDLNAIFGRARTLILGQRIDDTAKAESERSLLEKVKAHLRRSWQQVTQSQPTEQELIRILSLIRIEILDVDPGGIHEREAKNLLRASVLQEPEWADIAWETLVQVCHYWASQRSGGSREDLQGRLLKSGVALKAPRSFRDDIERLKEHSERTFNLLRPLSIIEMGDREIKIQRPVSRALREVAENGSIVVVGEPGAGKSGVLHDLVERLMRTETRDVVFLVVDRLEAHSLNALRQELRLKQDLVKVLQDWPGTQPGFLVIDALDAARSSATAQTLYDLLALIQTEQSRWRVVASVRQYDLRYNTKLQSLFKGQPPNQFCSNEFFSLCHLNVSRLSSEEWLELASQARELGELFVAADQKLRELLLVPFNIKLMADLLGRGIGFEQLRPIRTQIELLDLYWDERVAKPLDEKDAREILLSRAIEEMVRTRSLRANRRQIATTTSDSSVLKDLLSANILSEWQPNADEKANDAILTFPHHVLFDYAAARLLLRGLTQPLAKLLEDDPELVIAIRPSLMMHFEHERGHDLNQFWESIFRINSSSAIPEIGKLIGPSTAVEEAAGIKDFEPLIHALASADLSRREQAERAYRHVLGALTVKGSATEFIVGPRALNWSELMNQVTAQPRAATIYSSRPALYLICNQPDKMTDEQRQAAGLVSRRLLDFALAQTSRDLALVLSGLEMVCRTYESDAEASGAILRRCLEPEHVLQHGHQELFRLANEVERLMPIDPVIVEEIFQAAFTLMDESNEKTDMGISRIMVMTSTRRQDFQLARYKLASEYRKFVDQSSECALRVLIAALNGYPEERYSYWPFDVQREKSFEFNGKQAYLKADRSEVWSEGGGNGNHEEPLRMLNVFQNYLEQIGSDERKKNERERLIDLIAEKNRTAAIWRCLLKAAAKHPHGLGLEIRSVCWALPILTCDDTSQPVGELLKTIFALLSVEERVRIETTIISIPESVSEDEREYAERRRDRFLGCLDFSALVTEETRCLLSSLKESDAVPPNDPRFYPPVVSWLGTPTDAESLRGSGVSIEEDANRQLLSLIEPAKSFAGRFANERPSLAEAMEIISALQSLYTALKLYEESAHERTRGLAWGHLADASESVAKCEEFNCEVANAKFIKATLLEAASYPDPHPSQAFPNFDKHPSWGSPAARIDAAEGIMHLASKPSCVDPTLIEAIERLSHDPAPPVRLQIVSRLVALYHTTPELMWKLLEQFSREEDSRGVLQLLVVQSLNRLAARHAGRVAELVQIIIDRVRDGEGADEVQRHCASILAGLYVWQDEALSRQTVRMIADDPTTYNTVASQIVFNLRSWLNLGPIEPANASQDAVRSRSFDLLHHILQSTLNQTIELEAKYPGTFFSSWEEMDQAKGRGLARLADSVCLQVYFVSGAYRDNDAEVKVPLGVVERTRFWRESRQTLELLAQFGYASLSHHLLETLEYLLPFDPEEVFLLIGKVVRKGKEGGYQYESMAIDLIVKVVERFMAEYRRPLQENENCRRTLIEILDIFVEAGWPAARRVAYRIEEIFR